MKKFGIFLILVGIALIATPYILNKDLFNVGNKSEDKLGIFKPPLVKTINMKTANYKNPQIITFNFPDGLYCKEMNEFQINCHGYSEEGSVPLNPSLLVKSNRYNNWTIEDVIENRVKYTVRTKKEYTEIGGCRENMRCIKASRTETSGDRTYKIINVYLVIPNGDSYFTIAEMNFSTSKENTEEIIDSFISMIIDTMTIEPYVEEEMKYTDDNKIEVSLTVPRYNEASKIKVYLNKDKYNSKLGHSQYENTNNTFIFTSNGSRLEDGKTIFVAEEKTIQYIYDEINDSNEPLLQHFSDDTSPTLWQQYNTPKVIDGKEIYYSNDPTFYHYLYIINDYYAYYVKSNVDLSDEDLKEFFNIKFE